ncbi:MAG: hypothetical protein Q7S53_03535 [bacterium]|nr:hypothetical protein [bacterium]
MGIFKPNAPKSSKILLYGFALAFIGVLACTLSSIIFPNNWDLLLISMLAPGIPGMTLMLYFWFKYAPELACPYDRGECDGECVSKDQSIICGRYCKCWGENVTDGPRTALVRLNGGE